VSAPSSTKLALLAVGIAVLLWSMSFVLSAEVLKTSSPAVLSVGRFAIGLVILLPVAARRPGFAMSVRQPRTALLGLLGVALYCLFILGAMITTPTLVLFTYGAERLPAAITGAMAAAIPALGYLFALILGEPPNMITAFGGGIALVGVLIASTASPALDSSPPGSTLASVDGTAVADKP
jgi:drug/metabolite transporter (DMT)-like permease